MLQGRFHRKDRQDKCRTNIGIKDNHGGVNTTDAFSGQKQVQFQSILGFWQRKQHSSPINEFIA